MKEPVKVGILYIYPDGKVFNLRSKKFAKLRLVGNTVKVWDANIKKEIPLKNLIYAAFNEKIDANKKVVNINGKIKNNSITNLKLVDKYFSKTKYTPKQTNALKRKVKVYWIENDVKKFKAFTSLSAAAKYLNVTRQNIYENLVGNTKYIAKKYWCKYI